MMNKIVFLTVFIFVFMISSILFADSAIDKLNRGFQNLITSPAEIVYGINQAKEQGENTSSILPSKGVDSAILWGLPNGILRMAVRAVVGVYEVATFPFPVPSEYKPILRDLGENELFY